MKRIRRGGGAAHEPLEPGNPDAPALQVPDPAATLENAYFDREWALALMNRAVAVLEAEHDGIKAEPFAVL